MVPSNPPSVLRVFTHVQSGHRAAVTVNRHAARSLYITTICNTYSMIVYILLLFVVILVLICKIISILLLFVVIIV